jgi:hypothetical protein
MKESTIPVFIAIFIGIFISITFYSLGRINGGYDMREASRKNLVELKMAHYEVNPTTGQTTFTLHVPK